MVVTCFADVLSLVDVHSDMMMMMMMMMMVPIIAMAADMVDEHFPLENITITLLTFMFYFFLIQ